MEYVPYAELGERPNVIVDGAGADSTVLTLSHWPGSTVPASLQADLSAEIVLRYLQQPDQQVDVDVVSNNHFDEDGLLGVYALTAPEAALARRDLVVDVARAGDFGTSHTRHAARVAFAVSTLVDPAVSPLDPAVFDGDYPTMAAHLYRELLPRVPSLLDDIDAFRDLWSAEDAHLAASDAAFDRGDASIVEHPDLDLAVVTVPAAMSERVVHRFTQRRRAGLHPMAVHNRTQRHRVAYVTGRHYEVHLRYETWVQFVSRPVTPRPDLGVFADRLNDMESSGAKWHFDGVADITPRLALQDAAESGIDPERFEAELRAFLRDAAPAWDPWDRRNAH